MGVSIVDVYSCSCKNDCEHEKTRLNEDKSKLITQCLLDIGWKDEFPSKKFNLNKESVKSMWASLQISDDEICEDLEDYKRAIDFCFSLMCFEFPVMIEYW